MNPALTLTCMTSCHVVARVCAMGLRSPKRLALCSNPSSFGKASPSEPPVSQSHREPPWPNPLPRWQVRALRQPRSRRRAIPVEPRFDSAAVLQRRELRTRGLPLSQCPRLRLLLKLFCSSASGRAVHELGATGIRFGSLSKCRGRKVSST